MLKSSRIYEMLQESGPYYSLGQGFLNFLPLDLLNVHTFPNNPNSKINTNEQWKWYNATLLGKLCSRVMMFQRADAPGIFPGSLPEDKVSKRTWSMFILLHLVEWQKRMGTSDLCGKNHMFGIFILTHTCLNFEFKVCKAYY